MYRPPRANGAPSSSGGHGRAPTSPALSAALSFSSAALSAAWSRTSAADCCICKTSPGNVSRDPWLHEAWRRLTGAEVMDAHLIHLLGACLGALSSLYGVAHGGSWLSMRDAAASVRQQATMRCVVLHGCLPCHARCPVPLGRSVPCWQRPHLRWKQCA